MPAQDPSTLSGKCQLTKGVFIVRPCREPSVARCRSCAREVCARHARGIRSNPSCVECARKRVADDPDTDTLWLDSPSGGGAWDSGSTSAPGSAPAGGFSGGGGRSGGGGATGSWDAPEPGGSGAGAGSGTSGGGPSTGAAIGAGVAAGAIAGASAAGTGTADGAAFTAEDRSAFDAIADGSSEMDPEKGAAFDS